MAAPRASKSSPGASRLRHPKPAVSPAPETSGFELKLLGRPTLLRNGAPLVLGTQKSLGVLCYLGACGEAVSREQLSALLWPDSSEERARRSLRGELARLRSALPVGAIDGSRLDIWLDPSAARVDLQRFRSLVAKGRDTEAARLFRGSFCEGLKLRGAEPFQEWLTQERHLVERAYLQVLRRRINEEGAGGDLNSALEYARRGIDMQPLNEDFYVHAMDVADQLGDRAQVLKIYRDLQSVLHAELGIGPGPEAKAAVQRASGPKGASPSQARLVPAEAPAQFVGRARELEMMQQCQLQADAGFGSLVLVHGPAGVGKTRLVREVLGRRRSVWCRAQRATSNVAYLPIAAGLREYLAQWGVPAVKDVWLREAARVCPELSRAGKNQSLGGSDDHVRLIEGLAETLVGAVGRGGVIVFDNVELADPDTLAVLGDLVQDLARLTSTVVVVVICRSDLNAMDSEIAELFSAARRMGQFQPVCVEDLSASELRELVQSCLRSSGHEVEGSDWGDDFADVVYDVLGGNPFSAIECTRMAFDTSAESAVDPHSAIMSGIPDVVRARIGSLPQTLRQLAEAAATLGDPIAPDLLARVLDIGPWELAEALDGLVERRVLLSQKGSMRFSHHLLADVIYDSLPPAKRQMLHERAARALTASNSLDLNPVSAQIAAHFEACGRDDEAIPYHQRAAETARSAHAHQMAIYHYRRLRDLLPPDKQVPILLGLGDVLSYASTADAEAVYRDALQLATSQGTGREQAQCYFALGVLSRRRADLSGSRHALSEALRRFQIYQDQEGVESTLEALTYAHIQEGHLQSAVSSAAEAAEIAHASGRLSRFGRAQLSLGIAHLYGGDYLSALEAFKQALGIAADTGDELGEAEALRYVSAVYGADGRVGTPEQAWAAAERAIEICADAGHRMGLSRAADGLGGAYLVQGDWARALDCYVAGLDLIRSFGYPWGFDALVYRIGYTLSQSGASEAAEHVLHQAEALSRQLKAPYWLCRALMALGELGYASGDEAAAGSHAQEALHLARGLEHHAFIVEAMALTERNTGSRSTPRSQLGSAPSTNRGRVSLPDIPGVLKTRAYSPDEVLKWLDPLVDQVFKNHGDEANRL